MRTGIAAGLAILLPFAAIQTVAGGTVRPHLSGGNPSLTLLSASWYTDIVGAVHVVGEVKNTGATSADFPEVTVSYENSSNVLLGTDFTYTEVDPIEPGEKAPFAVITSSPPPGFTQVLVTGLYDEVALSPPNQDFTTTVTNSYVDDIGDTHIVGTVTNNNLTESQYVEVVFTFYNGSGAVADEDFTFVNTDASADLGPGQTGTFEEIYIGGQTWSSYATVTQSSSPPSLPVPPTTTTIPAPTTTTVAPAPTTTVAPSTTTTAAPATTTTNAPTTPSPVVASSGAVAPRIVIGSSGALAGSKLPVKLTCETKTCSGAVTLSESVTVKVKQGKKTVTKTESVVLARASYKLAPTKSETVDLTLNATGHAALAHVAKTP